MKLDQLLKYLGFVFGLIAFVFLLGGAISFFTGEFMHVRRFATFFYFANAMGIFSILSFVASIASQSKE